MIGLGTMRQNGQLKWALVLIPALGLAALAGMYSVAHPKRALAAGGLVVVGLFLLDLDGRGGTLAQRFRWIPGAWIALLLVTDLRFIDSDPRQVATGGLNLQHVVQISVYAVVTGLVVRARASLVPLWRHRVPKGLLMAWPIVAVLSASWSSVRMYSLVRGMQLLVIGALALLIVRIWLTDRSAGEDVFWRTLRLFVQVVSILAIVGLAVTGVSERFTWPGMHPGVAASFLGAALLILVIGGRTRLGLAAWTYYPRLVLFGTTLYLAHTRSVIAGLVLAVGLALWLLGREKPISRYLGVTYYVVGGSMLFIFAATQLLTYLSRGEDPESIANLTGRIPLWEFAIGQLDSVRDWALGFGYGSSRVVLIADFNWAGSAHSTWIELLLGVGLVGTILAAASIVTVAFWLGRRRSFGRANLVAISLLALFVMTSTVSEAMVLPGLGFGFLALIHVPALAQRVSSSQPGEEPVAAPPREHARR